MERNGRNGGETLRQSAHCRAVICRWKDDSSDWIESDSTVTGDEPPRPLTGDPGDGRVTPGGKRPAAGGTSPAVASR